MVIFLVGTFIVALLVSPLIVLNCEFLAAPCFFNQLDRFQTLIAGIVGFGGLVAAALYNGREDRRKEQRAKDYYARSLAHAFVLETSELGIECGHIAISAVEVSAGLDDQMAKGDLAAVFEDQFRAAAQPQETLLEGIDVLQIRLALQLGNITAETLAFSNPDGKMLSPDNLSRDWRRISDAKGLPRVTFHALRHTHASVLIRAGVDVLTVSRRLGHYKPSVTLDTYGHLIEGADAAAAAAIASVLARQ